MIAVVASHARHELVVVLGESQGLVHLQIREPPVAVSVVQVLLAVLQEHSDRLVRFGLSDEGRVDVATADVREAPDMTEHLAKGLLWSQPDAVARDIMRGVIKNRVVIYTPRFWGFIMWVIRLLPWFAFKRLRF